jgi:3',5'-cyclic AMP phosphodiesterase CpdA
MHWKHATWVILLLGACQGQQAPVADDSSTSKNGKGTLTVWEDATHFFVIGDWGRNGYHHQQDLADAMQEAAKMVEPEFIISTGDNFYPNGVASASDPYWISSFENVYRGDLLFVPWYVVLGNHDYRGNPQAQIDYSQISRRWTMPARYFAKDFVLDDDSSVARFVFLDSNPLEDDYYTEEKYREAVSGQDTATQLLWMNEALASPLPTWKIVVGHHPLYTGGKRAEEPNFQRGHLERHLEKHRVHAYFAGHEHDLQHNRAEGKFTDHFVSGAGSEVRPTGKAGFTRFAESVTGCMIVSLTPDSMLVQAMDYEGQVLYQYVRKDR